MHEAPATAVLTIDLDGLRANWRLLAAKAAPSQCAAVIKADAYGTGLEQAAAALWAEGARSFFVARAAEGARARTILPQAKIFVLDGLTPGSAPFLLAHDLIPVLGSMAEIVEWANAGTAALHVDTGMRRLGLKPAETGAGLAALGAPPAVVLSHFTSAENRDAPANAAQIAAVSTLAGVVGDAPLSLANSSGIFLDAQPFFHMVRPGVALYGGNPTPDLPNPMRPVVSLHAPIMVVRDVPAGAVVGYNGAWTARRASVIAIIGLGYADGLLRSAMGTDAKAGPLVRIEGVACPVVGRISMDLTAIDVTDAPMAARGARVEILGPHYGVDDLAAAAGTIGYEILTGLGRRYGRVYTGG